MASVVLTSDGLRKGLGKVDRTLDGTGFSFTQLNLSGKGLEDLGAGLLGNFRHLRQVNLSDNQLTDVAVVNKLVSLLSLDVSTNKLADIPDLSACTFLQVRAGVMQLTVFTAVLSLITCFVYLYR